MNLMFKMILLAIRLFILGFIFFQTPNVHFYFVMLHYSLFKVSGSHEGFKKWCFEVEAMKEEVIASSNYLSWSIGSYRIHVLDVSKNIPSAKGI